jgi:outer membrane protein TolC
MVHLPRCVIPVALGLALALAAPKARAQVSAPSSSSSTNALEPKRAFLLPEALAYAHAHQPSIHAALARVTARMKEAEIASGQWLPTVAATGQLFAMTSNNTTSTYVQPAFMDIPRIGGTSATTAGSLSPYASTLVGAGLTQQAFDFGRIGAERAAADALVQVEKHRADAERLDIDFGVEEAFFSVFAAKAVLKAAEEAYERSRVHRDLAKRGVDAGLRSPIELTRADADLERFDVGRVRARGGLAIAQSVLSAAIGAPDAAVDVAGDPVGLADMPALPEALAMAQARDPRLAETIAELKAAEETTRAVGAELRPDVSLTATLTGRAGAAPPSSGLEPTGAGWLPIVPNWDVGVVLSWPLFDGVIAARRNAAQSAEQVRRDEIDVRREQQVAEVRQTYVSVRVARAALFALARSVVAARANYDQADARFGAGIGNAVELADAENVRTDAEIQLAIGQFDLERSRAAFGRAIAEGL